MWTTVDKGRQIMMMMVVHRPVGIIGFIQRNMPGEIYSVQD